MKAYKILLSLLIVLALFVDSETLARRSSGGRSSGGSSSRGGYSGGSRSTTTRTTTRISRSGGGSFNGYRVTPVFSYGYGIGMYHPVGWVMGNPYYDTRYMYYYDGTNIYAEQKAASAVVSAIIIIIVCVVICGCCYVASKNQGSFDDGYEEETEVTTTTTTWDNNGQPQGGQTYAPGTNPPGTALCNSGHVFAFMTTNPYPDDSSTCDNCQQVIQFGYGGYHCGPCEVDLCKNCGDGRVSPN